MMPSLLCSLRSSFRGAGSRRYRPSSPASMVPRILSSLFLVLCPSASSCDIPLLLRRAPWFWSLFFSRSKAQPHHPPVDGRSSILAAESGLHTGCTEYTTAFDYSVICLRARTESPNMSALACTLVLVFVFFTIEGSTTPSARRRPLLHPCRRVQPTHRVH